MGILSRLSRMPFTVIGHRGAGGVKPENTLSAIEYAVRVGADIVEVDARMTRDGVIIAFHDEDFKRLFGVEVKVRNVDYEWIKNNIRYDNGETVPKLEDVLETVKDKVGLFVEVKEPDTTHKIVELIKNHGLTNDVALISFYDEALETAKKLSPSLAVGLIYYKPPGRIFDAKKLGAEIILPQYNIATVKANRLAHKLRLRVVVWTINKPELVFEMVRREVDGIASDYPDMLVKIRDNLSKTE